MVLGDNNLSWGNLDVSEFASGNPRWYRVSTLESMVPGFVEECVQVMEDVGEDLSEALSSIYDLVQAIANIIPYFSTLPGFLVSQLIAQVRQLLLDLLNSGLYFQFTGPTYGGSPAFGRRFTDSLLNPEDLNRPIFSTSAKVGSISFILGFPSLDAAQFFLDTFANFFSTTSQVIAKDLNTQGAKVQTNSYLGYYFTNLARKDREKIVNWLAVRLVDLLAGFLNADVVRYLDNLLTYLENLTTRNPYESFLVLLLKQIGALIADLTRFQTFFNDIQSLLENGPSHVFLVPPEVGGTVRWKDVMERGLQGSFNGPLFGNSTYVLGFHLVVGHADASRVDSSWNALTKFYEAAFENLQTSSERIGG